MAAVDIRSYTPRSQYPIYERIAAIAAHVAPSTWCVIGGLMTELILAERGLASPRTTSDGDILGHVAVDPQVMEKIEHVLTNVLHMTLKPSGASGAVACRYRDSDDDALFVDVLVPSRSRAADGIPKRLAAPGTGDRQFLNTLEERHVTWSDDAEPFTARYPSLAGALYIKATNWIEIIPPPDSDDVKREKHLLDAIALAHAATLTELQADPTKGFRKRLAALQAQVIEPTPTLRTHFTADVLQAVDNKLAIALDA